MDTIVTAILLILTSALAVQVDTLSVQGNFADSNPSPQNPLPGFDRHVRQRRWIFSWLFGHGASQDHVPSQQNASVPESKSGPVAEALRAPRVKHVARKRPGVVDISGDTRVNYADSRGRAAELASESDAEVFNWNVLQEDRDRHSDSVHPYYFQLRQQTIAKPDFIRNNQLKERPMSGRIRDGNKPGYVYKVYSRVPIPFEQSQEFALSADKTRG